MRFAEDFPGKGTTLAAIAVIAVLTIGGLLSLRDNFHRIEAEIPQIEATKLRDGFIALGDLNRLDNAVDWAVSEATVTPEKREAVRAALDRLAPRVQRFERLIAGNEVAEATRITRTFNAILSGGRDALAAGPEALRRYEVVLDDQLESARDELVRFVDSQYRVHGAALAEQTRLLRRMTVNAALLLLVLGFVSAAVVAALKSQKWAHRKRLAAERQAHFLAHFDPLTGLFNRTRFHECAGGIVAREPAPAVMLADLDEFKAINDAYGHAAGDAVLSEVAVRVAALVAEHRGHAARLGGDEFAAVVPGPLSREAAEEAGRRLLEAVAAPVQVDGLTLAPGASVGVCRAADLAEGQAATVSALLKAADLALYQAKAAGRGTVVLHDRALAERIAAERDIERALPEALRRGEIFAMFQPQVDLADGRICGVEALVRWRRGDEVLLPARFIPVAEASGAVIDIDRTVLREATRTVAGWNAEGPFELSVSVNLSPRHFSGSAIVDDVRAALEDSGLRPQLLTLEITETVILENWQNARELIGRLRALGVHIALDDFGSGYSGFGYLQELPIDVIKIDRGLVSRLDNSDDAQFILDALVEMAGRMAMTVVVEGVETLAELEVARKLGCNTGQGFYFDRPMEANALRARLATASSPRSATS